MELMIVIVIIGILAGIAMPIFSRTIEATKAKEALAALQQIRTGERIYRVEENDYWPVGSSESVIATINNTLRTFLDTRSNRNWNYSVTASSGTPDTFTATATRIGGGYNGKTIVFDQAGLDQANTTWPLPIPGQ
ncbi:MAG: hypothetical protein NG712_05455 [Omnitrophica bacterium]|nr:hypothetical protein [Candidatus Omnitrophota bacterium]